MITRRRTTILQIVVIAVLIMAPLVSYAAPSWWPLVPCGLNNPPADAGRTDHNYTQPCNQCLLLMLGDNIIDMIFTAVVPMVGTMFFIIAGFLILTGGAAGNTTQVGKGQNLFKSTIYGIAIIASSWLVTNFILKSLAADEDVSGDWNVIECRTGTLSDIVLGGNPPGPQPPGPGQPPPVSGGDTCNNQQALAQQHNTTYPRRRSAELDQLLSCIAGRLNQSIPGEGASNPYYGSLYTYDASSPICNYTRADRHCDSSCSHAANSCHYGGRTGTEGSLAADFGNERNGEAIKQAALACGARSARCENNRGQTVACNAGANHIHISSQSCDAN